MGFKGRLSGRGADEADIPPSLKKCVTERQSWREVEALLPSPRRWAASAGDAVVRRDSAIKSGLLRRDISTELAEALRHFEPEILRVHLACLDEPTPQPVTRAQRRRAEAATQALSALGRLWPNPGPGDAALLEVCAMLEQQVAEVRRCEGKQTAIENSQRRGRGARGPLTSAARRRRFVRDVGRPLRAGAGWSWERLAALILASDDDWIVPPCSSFVKATEPSDLATDLKRAEHELKEEGKRLAKLHRGGASDSRS